MCPVYSHKEYVIQCAINSVKTLLIVNGIIVNNVIIWPFTNTE